MILDFDIGYLVSYGFALAALCSFFPVAGVGIWHILRMI